MEIGLPYSKFLIMLIPLYLGIFLNMIMPSLLMVFAISRRFSIDSRLFSVLILGSFSLLGFITFWLTMVHPEIGRVWGGVIVLSWLIPFVFWLLYKLKLLEKLLFINISEKTKTILEEFSSFMGNPDIKYPVLFKLIAGFLVLSYLFAAYTDRHYETPGRIPEQVAFRLHGEGAELDYNIQYLTAESVRNGRSIFNRVLGFYRTKATDRPPLLAGIALRNYIFPTGFWNHFYITCIIAQLSWILVFWSFFRLTQLSVKKTWLGCLFVFHFGFLLIHTLFAWPKLLAGSLLMGAALVLLFPLQNAKKNEKLHHIFAAVLAAFALFSHMGVASALLPITLIYFYKYRPVPWRATFASLIVLILLLAPWQISRRVHENSSIGFSGVRYLMSDSRDEKLYFDENLSTGEVIVKSYEQRTWGQIIDQKIENLRSIFTYQRWGGFEKYLKDIFTISVQYTQKKFKYVDFANIPGSMFPIIFLLFFLPFKAFWKTKKPMVMTGIRKSLFIFVITGLVTAMISFNTGLSCGMFSFTPLLLLFASLTRLSFNLKDGYFVSIWVLAVALFHFTYVFFTPSEEAKYHVALSLFCTVCYVFLCIKMMRLKPLLLSESQEDGQR